MQTTATPLKKINIWDILLIEKQQHAGFWLRFLAFLIDFSIVALLLYPFFSLIIENTTDYFETELAVKILVLTILFSFTLIVISFLYQFICELSILSSTIGYRLVGIKTIDKFGRNPTPSQFFLRTSTKFLTFFGFVPFLLIICAFTRNKQNIQDLVLGAFVVKSKFIYEIYENNLELLILHEINVDTLIMKRDQRADFAKKLEAAKNANNYGQTQVSQVSNTPSIVI